MNGVTMNVSDGIDVYLRERAGVLRPATIAKHGMTLFMFRATFGEAELDSITLTDLEQWRGGLRIRPTSANKYMDRIGAFYRHMRKRGYCATNPVEQLDALDEGIVRRPRIDPTLLPAMLDSARHPRDRAFLAVAVELLLRANEIANLKVADFRGDHLRVLVEKQRGELTEDEMAISPALASVIESWLGDYRRTAGLVTGDAYLFPRRDVRRAGNQALYVVHPHTKMAHPEEIVKLALTSIGQDVERGTGVHAVRRTCARLLFDYLVEHEGADRALTHVSALLHHASRQTTELYLGVAGDRVLRNKFIRNGGTTPLRLATSGFAKVTPTKLAGSSVYQGSRRTV